FVLRYKKRTRRARSTTGGPIETRTAGTASTLETPRTRGGVTRATPRRARARAWASVSPLPGGGTVIRPASASAVRLRSAIAPPIASSTTTRAVGGRVTTASCGGG